MLLFTELSSKLIDKLTHTSVVVVCFFTPCVYLMSDSVLFCLMSLCGYNESTHLSTDKLPILVWAALACFMSMEMSSVERHDKRQSTSDVSH